MIAEDGEGPHKGPAVGMQLGRGNIYFGQQLPLEAGKRKALRNTLKDRLIEEEEGFSLVGTVVYTHGFTLCAGVNRDIGVALSPKRPTLELRLAIQVHPPVCDQRKGGCFSKEFIGCPGIHGLVVGIGWRVRGGLRLCHDEGI